MSNFNTPDKTTNNFEKRLAVVTPETLQMMYGDIYKRLPKLNESDFKRYSELLGLIRKEAILRKIDLVKPKIKI